MNNLRQVGTGILLAAISIALVLGGFILSTAQGRTTKVPAPSATFQLVIPSGLPTLPVKSGNTAPTFTPTFAAQPTDIIDTFLPSSTPPLPVLPSPTILFPTVINQPAGCPVPRGWITMVVQPGDTLSSIASTYGMAQSAIIQGNCLTNTQLQVGRLLYIFSYAATSTYTAPIVTCGAPYGWITYYVTNGDTLYGISLRYQVTVAQLKVANCLGASDYIQVGQAIKVPNVATSAPPATSKPAATATAYPTSVPPTKTPYPTAAPTTAPTIAPSDTPFSSSGPG